MAAILLVAVMFAAMRAMGGTSTDRPYAVAISTESPSAADLSTADRA